MRVYKFGALAALVLAITAVPVVAQSGAVQPSDTAGHPSAADVAFMTDMIGHHQQAILISGWCPTHGASQSLQTLCSRIVVGQQDEIAVMNQWLKEHGETLPGADSSHQMMAGMDHDMPGMKMMPGMLNASQLAQLNAAHGAEFDRLFLTYMIKHHEGALTMVDELFGSQSAAQDNTVYKVATDIYAEQTTEIARMNKMLAALPPG
jgi:uncharacterized protein (DUF305 family)